MTSAFLDKEEFSQRHCVVFHSRETCGDFVKIFSAFLVIICCMLSQKEIGTDH